MTMCEAPPRRARRCSTSARALTRLRRRSANGIARSWNTTLSGRDRLDVRFDLRALRQRPSVAGLMSKPSVAENVAPHRPERNPKGLLPGLLMPPGMRSEEHTSELQSQFHLV